MTTLLADERGNSPVISTSRALFIINPNSGTGRRRPTREQILYQMGSSQWESVVMTTRYAGHAAQLARQARARGDALVVAVGGDGTVHEVGSALIGSKTALGILPVGSGNGLARHLRIPSNPEAAMELIGRGRRCFIDTVSVGEGERNFLNVAGVGFDACVAESFSHTRARGMKSYAACIAQKYPFYCKKEFHLTIDGEEVRRKAFLLSFANSSQYGNNFTIAPKADMSDGLFEVAVVNEAPLWAMPTVLLHLANGTIDRSPFYECWKARRVTVHGEQHLLHLDGEPLDYEGDIHLTSNPRSLEILVP